MARNIEIKARITSIAQMLPTVRALADEGPIEMTQDDTFFRCANGRLKLRALSPAQGELIFYRRENRKGPKESFYLRSATAEPEQLRRVLSLAYGEAGRICKHRTLFLVGRTRVHLDRVEGLGEFLELEVVLGEQEAPGAGIQEAGELLQRLGIDGSQLIDRAYVDMLQT